MLFQGLCGQCSDEMYELRDKDGINQYGNDNWEDIVGDSFAVYNQDYPEDTG